MGVMKELSFVRRRSGSAFVTGITFLLMIVQYFINVQNISQLLENFSSNIEYWLVGLSFVAILTNELTNDRLTSPDLFLGVRKKRTGWNKVIWVASFLSLAFCAYLIAINIIEKNAHPIIVTMIVSSVYFVLYSIDGIVLAVEYREMKAIVGQHLDKSSHASSSEVVRPKKNENGENI